MYDTDAAPPRLSNPRRQATHGGSGSQLVFNFLPIRFVGDEFDADVVGYESSEQLATLRTQFADTHTVSRLGAEQIVCVPYQSEVEAVGEPTTFTIADAERGLLARLSQAALLRALTRGWGFQLRKFGPPTFVSRLPGRDLIAKAAGANDDVRGLHVYPQYRLDVRRSGPGGYPGIIVGLKARYEIDLSISRLIQRGVQIIGKYVLMTPDGRKEVPFQDPLARRRLLGVVEAVVGDHLRVGTLDGPVQVPASAAWLEARRDNFLEVLQATVGGSHDRVVSRLEVEAFAWTGAEGRLARTEEIADGLIKLGPLPIANGVFMEIGKPAGSGGAGRGKTRPPLKEPTFVFDLAGDKTNRFQDRGLIEFGPFGAEAFTPKAPHIAVVTPQQFRGTVEGFMRSFRDGVKGSAAFSQGFVRKYRLTNCTMTFTAFDGDVRDAAAYRQACVDAITASDEINLAIVITGQEQEHLSGNASPYLVAKSTFMGQGIPVQEFQIENLERADIAHLLNTATLACYAKLGGTPYVIAVPTRAMAHELVIGIGNAHISQGRLGPPERYVGITSVFSSDGHYFVSNVSKEAQYDQYPQELLRTLRTCIEDVRSRNAWQPQDTVRLIFHIFKPLKDQETRVVKSLVEEVTKDYAGVDFAFLHVSNDHDWMMFDRASTGTGQGNRAKGRLVPARGHAVRIGMGEILVAVSGPYDLKLPSQGAPQPLLLKLHRESTFTDLDYLAGQVFRFTALSWRRPYPSGQPVTILYSNLIANLLGQLRHVTNWNSDIIATKLRWSRWFL